MSKILGIPDVVLAKARHAGAHNDCLVAGPERCCPGCAQIMHIALDQTYGDLDSPLDVIAAVLTDLDAETGA